MVQGGMMRSWSKRHVGVGLVRGRKELLDAEGPYCRIWRARGKRDRD